LAISATLEACTVLSTAEVANLSTDPAVLADGLRLANHFHALGLGLKRASVTAGVAWLLTGIAKEVHGDPELNPDGLDRLRVARWLLAVLDVQLEAIDQLGVSGLDQIEELIGVGEICAPAIGSSREAVHAP
jgi:hypothetical protein